MMINIVGPILLLIFSQFAVDSPLMGGNTVSVRELASEQISLEKRYNDPYVNGVMKDNILLNMAYLSGSVGKRDDINWDKVRKPFEYDFTLLPGKTFAYHDDVFDQYKSTLAKTTNARFNFDDGFKSDGYLVGDGICHLASLIYWVAKNAGLDAYAPTNHDFAPIPEIDKKYGVSIYKMPGQESANARQNLYITNNKEKPVVFNFSYKDNQLKLSVYEDIL